MSYQCLAKFEFKLDFKTELNESSLLQSTVLAGFSKSYIRTEICPRKALQNLEVHNFTRFF